MMKFQLIKITIHDFICDKDVILATVVRNTEHGDRIRLKGMNGTKKVKDIFIDQKIPMQERDQWPIVTDGNGKYYWLAWSKEKCIKKVSNNRKLLNINI